MIMTKTPKEARESFVCEVKDCHERLVCVGPPGTLFDCFNCGQTYRIETVGDREPRVLN